MKARLVVKENECQQVLLDVPPSKMPAVAVLVYIEIGKVYRPFNKPHGRASLWNDVQSRRFRRGRARSPSKLCRLVIRFAPPHTTPPIQLSATSGLLAEEALELPRSRLA